jgi:hypothetical protein
VKWRMAAILVGFAWTALSVQASSPTDADRFLIDIEAKSIASVTVKDSAPQLRKRFGAANVAKSSERLEGDPSPNVVVSIDGHKLIQHWNHVSTADPAFKTKDGLGPGSALAAFERVYGAADRGEGEGGWYGSFSAGKSMEFQVGVGDECFDEQLSLKRDSKCVVREILL